MNAAALTVLLAAVASQGCAMAFYRHDPVAHGEPRVEVIEVPEGQRERIMRRETKVLDLKLEEGVLTGYVVDEAVCVTETERLERSTQHTVDQLVYAESGQRANNNGLFFLQSLLVGASGLAAGMCQFGDACKGKDELRVPLWTIAGVLTSVFIVDAIWTDAGSGPSTVVTDTPLVTRSAPFACHREPVQSTAGYVGLSGGRRVPFVTDDAGVFSAKVTRATPDLSVVVGDQALSGTVGVVRHNKGTLAGHVLYVRPIARGTDLTELYLTTLAEAGLQLAAPEVLQAVLTKVTVKGYKVRYSEKTQVPLGEEHAPSVLVETSVLDASGRCTVVANAYDLRTKTTLKSAQANVGCEDSALAEGVTTVARTLAL